MQGDAEVPDRVEGFEEELRFVFKRQPAGGFHGSNPLARYLLGWYYMRLVIRVAPRRILWWPGADFGRRPLGTEVGGVG